jgi:hypothetical protein
MQRGNADDAPSRFGDPDLLVRQDDIRDPGAILVRGVQIWQIGQRLAHRGPVHCGNRVGIPRLSGPDQEWRGVRRPR